MTVFPFPPLFCPRCALIFLNLNTLYFFIPDIIIHIEIDTFNFSSEIEIEIDIMKTTQSDKMHQLKYFFTVQLTRCCHLINQ